LDLDNNGVSTTTAAQGGSVLVDIDNDGFAEQTEWINPRDAILVLDRDGDGKIEGGHEMFADANINTQARGLHALDEIDANGDGLLTTSDFAFAHLKAWQDINHDGVVQSYELASLSSKGITELNINTGQFVMNGQNNTLAITALSADSAGYITQAVGNSLMVSSLINHKHYKNNSFSCPFDEGYEVISCVKNQKQQADNIFWRNAA
jgi:hypothetical protein